MLTSSVAAARGRASTKKMRADTGRNMATIKQQSRVSLDMLQHRWAARMRLLSLFVLVTAATANAQSTLQWNGFALLRPQTTARVPLDGDKLSAQFQLGLDWRPFAGFGTHLHVLARNEGDKSH